MNIILTLLAGFTGSIRAWGATGTALSVLLAGCSAPTSVSPDPPSADAGTPAAAGLIAIGHSGLTGENSDPTQPGREVRANSWATGTNPAVDSIYQRMLALHPQAADPVANTAQAGATAARLADQARQALATVPRPALAIIQTIDNDIRCDGTDPTHVKEFGGQLETALKVIADASASTQILLVTEPGRPGAELRQMAPLIATQPGIRRNYTGPPPCGELDPGTGAVVPAGVAALTSIIEAYEAEQSRVCAEFVRCTTDDGRLATFVHDPTVVSADGNHLNVTGLARLAELTWPVARRVLTPATATSAATDPAPSPCPNPEGGACVGELAAGRTYRTTVFSPRTTYTITEPGWSNFEDTPGNFLLVPPGNDLPGVNAGTSDFIGIYTSVTPSTFRHPPDCAARPVPGIAPTPQAMLAWMRTQPSITMTDPVRTAVGGLPGLVTDIAVKPGATLPVCQEGGSTFSVALLFSGLPPSSLDHGVIPGITMRLYLLAYRGHVLAIELDDIDSAPGRLTSLTTTVERLAFAP